MKRRSSNSSGKIGFFSRIAYLRDLFMMRWKGRKSFDNSRNLSRIDEYRLIASKYGIDLKSSQILEIGIGARPYLGITFYGLGYCYKGIDLDLPTFPLSFIKAWKILRANGFLRLLKTFVRFYLFDKAEYADLFNQLDLSPRDFKHSSTFAQGDAAAIDLASLFDNSASSDLGGEPIVVVSESVFEHIPSIGLTQILENLKNYAHFNGRKLLILTRPTVFTGICGSHLTEWYHHNVYSSKKKKSEPWEHLRKKRFVADTYLNCLSRQEYRNLFVAAGYNIVSETVEHPGFGKEYLFDEALRSELSGFSDEELLSNEVMFELVPSPLNPAV